MEDAPAPSLLATTGDTAAAADAADADRSSRSFQSFENIPTPSRDHHHHQASASIDDAHLQSNHHPSDKAATAPAAAAPAPAVQQQPQSRRFNRVLVNPRQKGNPVLNHIKKVAWEYSDILPDFQVGQTSCALFLSLKYHRLHPEYIFERIKSMQHQYLLRILLVIVDIDDHQQSIRELTKGAILAGFTLFLAWSVEEAGTYIETFKAYESKPPDLIKEKVDGDYLSKLTDCLTNIKSVNKTDVLTLSSNFGSLKSIMETSADELALCPGIGEQKVRRLHDAFNQPFVMNKKRA